MGAGDAQQALFDEKFVYAYFYQWASSPLPNMKSSPMRHLPFVGICPRPSCPHGHMGIVVTKTVTARPLSTETACCSCDTANLS